MTIGICDDEGIIRRELRRICNQLLVQNGMDLPRLQ